MKLRRTFHYAKQRLTKYKSLFLRATKTYKRHVSVKKIRLSNNKEIQIKIRNFRTNKSRRSQKTKQLTVQVPFKNIREIAVVLPINIVRKEKPTLSKRQFTAKTIMAIGVLGIVFFGSQFMFSLRTRPSPVLAQVEETVVREDLKVESVIQKPTYLNKSVPTSIQIPEIGVEAAVEKVGLEEDGSLETPDLFSDLVGWYEFGPTPGEKGPAILVGHVDTYKGPSVFWSLSKLKNKDVIEISRKDGQVVKYEVTKIEAYPQDRFLTEEVYGNIDHAGLRIITCGGAFNYVTGKYSHNTIVFARLIT